MTNDEKIIRRVFGRKYSPSSKDSWSNMTSSEALTNCDKLDNAEGKYDMCMDASVDCVNDADCELARKYAQALKEGYSKDFSNFKRNAKLLGFLNTGISFLDNFLNKPQGNTGGGTGGGGGGDDDDKGLSMGAKIGIGVGIVAILGTITYFIIKK